MDSDAKDPEEVEVEIPAPLPLYSWRREPFSEQKPSIPIFARSRLLLLLWGR